MKKERMKYLFWAIRPKTLPAGISPVLLALAYSYAKTGHLKSSLAGLATLLCATLLQIAANLGNDYYDGIDGIDSGHRLGPTRITAAGLLPPKLMKEAFLICLLSAFFIGLALSYYGGVFILIIGLLSILFCYLYTGGPFPLSRFALGELLAFIFFGIIPVVGTAYIQGLKPGPDLYLLGSGMGFLSAAILAINNIRDRNNDLKKRKYTLSVLFGEKLGRILPLLFVLLSLIPPLYFSIYWPLLLFFFFYKTWLPILKHPLDSYFNKILSQTGLFLFLYTLSLIIGFLL